MDKLFYTLDIQCGMFSRQYHEYIEKEAFEEWNDSPTNHMPLKNISYTQVEKLNGKHVIYGIIEMFEQAGVDSLEWYDRDIAKYSWKWDFLFSKCHVLKNIVRYIYNKIFNVQRLARQW